MSFHPYLNFGGNCREAFTRYQEILGGELAIMSMADMPSGDGADVPPDQQDLVVHAALTVGDDVLMASDAPGGDFGPVQGMYVNLSLDDPDEARRVFDALAEGGTVEMPLSESFFAEAFGICTDRFGTPWMVIAGARTGMEAS